MVSATKTANSKQKTSYQFSWNYCNCQIGFTGDDTKQNDSSRRRSYAFELPLKFNKNNNNKMLHRFNAIK